MPDIWFDVDTAIAEAPANVLPLLDDTDFKTRETELWYNAPGLDVVWNFVTTGGSYAQTAVAVTTSGGDYDWGRQGDAMYSIGIPAAGGASINNDTEGFGWFTGVATGVLPWRGPVIGFRNAALNNSLVDGATIGVNVTSMDTGVVTAAAIATGAIDADAVAADVSTEIDAALSAVHGAGAWGGAGGGTIYGEGGSITFTYTLYDVDGITPLPGAAVWVSSDAAGTLRSQSKITDDLGQVQFDLDAGTVYFWRSHPLRTFTNPDTEVVN